MESHRKKIEAGSCIVYAACFTMEKRLPIAILIYITHSLADCWMCLTGKDDFLNAVSSGFPRRKQQCCQSNSTGLSSKRRIWCNVSCLIQSWNWLKGKHSVMGYNLPWFSAAADCWDETTNHKKRTHQVKATTGDDHPIVNLKPSSLIANTIVKRFE